MTTFSQGRPIDPTDGSKERVRASLQQMASEGPCPLLAPLRWNRTLGRLEVDPAGLGGGTPQEVIDARSHVLLGSFVSLDARLDTDETIIWAGTGWTSATYFTLLTSAITGGGVLESLLGQLGTFTNPANGSILKIINDVKSQSLQVNGASYANTVFGTSLTLGISGSGSTSVLTFNNVTTLQVISQFADAGSSAWHTPPAIGSLTRGYLQNLAWQLAYVIGYLSNLDRALKNKGIIQ